MLLYFMSIFCNLPGPIVLRFFTETESKGVFSLIRVATPMFCFFGPISDWIIFTFNFDSRRDKFFGLMWLVSCNKQMSKLCFSRKSTIL